MQVPEEVNPLHEEVVADLAGPPNGGAKAKLVTANTITYDMGDFLRSCADRYLELAKLAPEKLRRVDTPFLDDRGNRGRA